MGRHFYFGRNNSGYKRWGTGNHSKAGHDYQIIKQPKTYEQQVELIKEKGFIVNNDTECISF